MLFRFAKWLLVLCSLFLPAACHAVKPATKDLQTSPSATTRSVDVVEDTDVQMGIILGASEVHLGQPFAMRTITINHASESCTFFFATPGNDYDFIVLDAQQHRMDLTPKGEAERHRKLFSKHLSMLLHPGEHFVDSISNLFEFVDFQKPGEYTIQVERSVYLPKLGRLTGSYIEVSSNVVHAKVVP